MPSELRLSLDNDLSELARVRPAFRRFLEECRASGCASYAAEVAFEEIITNIMKYAYDDAVHHEIRIHALVRGEDLVIRFEDDGVAFDPTIQREPPKGPLEKRQVGGLGLILTRNLVDYLTYSRSGGRNHLEIRIALAGAPSD